LFTGDLADVAALVQELQAVTEATGIKDYNMLNMTESTYSEIVPVEYPTVGQNPSKARIGVIDISTAKTTWLNIPGDPQQNYLPRAEWRTPNEIYVEQLNRAQNEAKIFNCNPVNE